MTDSTNLLLAYTKSGERLYTNIACPDAAGLNGDLDDSLHLALSRNGGEYTPLRNDTGIAFAKSVYDGTPGGVTKTLIRPWLFRLHEGGFGLCAIRYGQGEPDESSEGSVLMFRSDDLIDFEEVGLIHLDDVLITEIRCRQDGTGYQFCWKRVDGGCRTTWGESPFVSGLLTDPKPLSDAIIEEDAPIIGDYSAISGCIPGNEIVLSDEEACRLESALGPIRHIGVRVEPYTVSAGCEPASAGLPKAICEYSDGSTHVKPVIWDLSDLESVDWTVPGTYCVRGTIAGRSFPFPFIDSTISDPCLCRVGDRWFETQTWEPYAALRASDTLSGLHDAEPVVLYDPRGTLKGVANMWAQEMHVIAGVPYLFTTLGPEGWTSVQSVVLRCTGNPEDPTAWEAPRYVMRQDGSLLAHGGISLDMTYFEDDERHYVMWSGRRILNRESTPPVTDSANLYIAEIDPSEPWRLISEPVCILKPQYGWDRCQTPVDEGPYALRHGDDLFVTFSGSSTELNDLYCIGLLCARQGSNLLDPDAWRCLGRPLLTKESIPGEYGPGHNAFITDPETGDDLMVYHAVRHDADGRSLGRYMAIRRVHWGANGLPYLEMTPERDVEPSLSQVMMTVTVV